MAYSIMPIDMSDILLNNGDLDVDTLELYKSYEIADTDITYHMGRPVMGKVTVNGKKYLIRLATLGQNKTGGFKVSRIITVPHPDPVVNRWGDWHVFGQKHDAGLYDWMHEKVSLYLLSTNPSSLVASSSFDFVQRLKLFNPMRSAIAFGKISVYQSRKDYDNDRQVAMKPGRAFKLMFDLLDDATVLAWVDEYLDRFAPRQYNLQVSKKASDFTKAYVGEQVKTQNITHSYNHKSLANSCMRYTFKDGNGPNNLPVHPVEAYASGDFTIAWVEDKDGLIGGRVVIYHDGSNDPQAGPIYGACDIAVRQLSDHIEAIGGEFADDGDWSGAKLVAHPYPYGNSDSFIAPYLDIEPRSLSVSQDRKHLIIDHDGDLDANSYQGILSEGGRDLCISCQDNVHEDESYHSEHTGETYCMDCYYEDHFHCDYTGEDVHMSQSIRVYAMCRHGEQDQNACESILGCQAVECKDGKIWDVDDCFHCVDEDQWISPPDADDYFNSDWDSEWYYSDSNMCVLLDGDVVSKQEIEDHEDTWVLTNGVYHTTNENGMMPLEEQE